MNRSALESQFECSEYFSSAWAASGLYDAPSQLMFVLPASEIELIEQEQFLGVARPGVDGILFGYRSGQPGIWAYYPSSGEFKFMSPSLSGFVEGWFGGSLFVQLLSALGPSSNNSFERTTGLRPVAAQLMIRQTTRGTQVEFGPKFIWDAPVPAWYFLSFITLAMVAFLFWAKLQPAVQLVARMVSALSFVVGFLALLYAAALPFKMGVDWRVFVPEGQFLDFRFRPTLTLVLLGVAFAGAVMLVRHGIQRRRVV